MKKILLLLFLFSCMCVWSQNLIGKSKKEVYEYLVIKGVLKDKIQTGKRMEDNAEWIAFSDGDIMNMYIFNPEGMCKYYRKIYPNAYLSEITKSLKEKNTVVNDSTWETKVKDQTFLINLIKDEKYFMVDQLKKTTTN